jgi:hypothetical protein
VSQEQIPQLVAQKLERLGRSSECRRGAAVAAILSRRFVLAGPGWMRWPEWPEAVGNGLRLVTDQLAGLPLNPDRREEILQRLSTFDVEDDGSDEWEHAIDVVSTLIRALEGADLDQLLEHAATTYLDGTFTLIANRLADENGGVISHAEADRRVATTEAWREARAFLDGV